MSAAVSDRLPRLLALVPYFLARPGILIDEAAAELGVTVAQLRRDLELLWMCGLPGYGPGDLIDLSFDSDSVTVTFDAGMNRPLRLAAAEATALVVALRALVDTPGVDGDAAQRALAKIESAAGSAARTPMVVGLATREEAATASVRAALDRRRALHLRYYTASRDAVSERVVDPMRLLLLEGRSYLEAWCRHAESVRLFRLDRIEDVAVLDETAAPPPHARPTDVSAGLFRPAPDQQVAVLVLSQEAAWVAEYYPVDEVVDLGDGRIRVHMRYADQAWMVRLLLGLGPDVVVEEPADLAGALRRRAAAALARAGHLHDGPGDR
ncbi:MAG TPA: YafY family protein [Pseudonocardiaceae bacterium]